MSGNDRYLDSKLLPEILHHGGYTILPHESVDGFEVKAIELINKGGNGSPIGMIHFKNTENNEEYIVYLFMDDGQLCHVIDRQDFSQKDRKKVIIAGEIIATKYTGSYPFLHNISGTALNKSDYDAFWNAFQSAEDIAELQKKIRDCVIDAKRFSTLFHLGEIPTDVKAELTGADFRISKPWRIN